MGKLVGKREQVQDGIVELAEDNKFELVPDGKHGPVVEGSKRLPVVAGSKQVLVPSPLGQEHNIELEQEHNIELVQVHSIELALVLDKQVHKPAGRLGDEQLRGGTNAWHEVQVHNIREQVGCNASKWCQLRRRLRNWPPTTC